METTTKYSRRPINKFQYESEKQVKDPAPVYSEFKPQFIDDLYREYMVAIKSLQREQLQTEGWITSEGLTVIDEKEIQKLEQECLFVRLQRRVKKKTFPFIGEELKMFHIRNQVKITCRVKAIFVVGHRRKTGLAIVEDITTYGPDKDYALYDKLTNKETYKALRIF